jgi:hypothetical protein
MHTNKKLPGFIRVYSCVFVAQCSYGFSGMSNEIDDSPTYL